MHSPAQTVHILLLGLVLFGLSACGGYDTDVPPPPPHAKASDIFPAEIGGLKPTISRMSLDKRYFVGFTATYGESSISAMKGASKKSVSAWFKTEMVPVIDGYQNHSRGSINGDWFGRGSKPGGEQIHAWVNGPWIFTLKANSRENLEALVDAFPYISR